MKGETILFILMLIIAAFTVYINITTYQFYEKATYEDKLAPADYFNESQILIGTKEEGYWTQSDYYVLIPMNQKPFVSKFAGTGSMRPLFDEQSNAIEIEPKSPMEIHAGDIISYKLNETDIIVHRILSTGTDNEGWFAIAKGDNNPIDDGHKIRFPEVNGKMVMVIY